MYSVLNMFKLNNIRLLSTVVLLIITFTIPNIIGVIAQTNSLSEDDKIVSERILSLDDENVLIKSKKDPKIETQSLALNESLEFNGGREKLSKQVEEIKKLSSIEVLAVNEKNIEKSSELSLKQKKIAKQIQKIITNYIQKEFGKNSSVYNLNEIQKNSLEVFINSDKKIQRLNKINSQKEVANFGEISVNAARWESCEWETSFPDWVGYQYKTYYGQKANWVGRLANTEDERSGIMPCDFSFYLNGYRVNKVDGWSIATECAVRWDNGISVRRYGYSNQKMIIGHGKLTACGVWSFNTEMLRDQIRFYS
jgi:hypothetical protein